jgi:hypothetical protein
LQGRGIIPVFSLSRSLSPHQFVPVVAVTVSNGPRSHASRSGMPGRPRWISWRVLLICFGCGALAHAPLNSIQKRTVEDQVASHPDIRRNSQAASPFRRAAPICFSGYSERRRGVVRSDCSGSGEGSTQAIPGTSPRSAPAPSAGQRAGGSYAECCCLDDAPRRRTQCWSDSTNRLAPMRRRPVSSRTRGTTGMNFPAAQALGAVEAGLAVKRGTVPGHWLLSFFPHAFAGC